MESPSTQFPEGTSRIPLHPSQREVAAADSSLAPHCSCAWCSAPRTPRLVRLTPFQICVWAALPSGRQELCRTEQEQIHRYLWGSADVDEVN